MKAILVIDMPTDCVKCPLGNCYCWKTFPIKGRADGCPLRPLPEKRHYSDELANEKGNDMYMEGWNDCLAEITGEKE